MFKAFVKSDVKVEKLYPPSSNLHWVHSQQTQRNFGKKKSYLLANTIVQAQLGFFKELIFNCLGKFSFVADQQTLWQKIMMYVMFFFYLILPLPR